MPFYFVQAADHLTPVENPANVEIYLQKVAGDPAELATGDIDLGVFGWHWYTPSDSDLDTLGEIAVVAFADDCDPFPFVFSVEPTTLAEDVATLAAIKARTDRIGVGGSLAIQSIDQAADGEFFAGADYHVDALTRIELRVTGKPDMTGLDLYLGVGVDASTQATVATIAGGVVVSGAPGDQVVGFSPTRDESILARPLIGRMVEAVVRCDFPKSGGGFLRTPCAWIKLKVRNFFLPPS